MDDLIKEFIDLTSQRRKFENIPKKANAAYKKRHEVFKKLKKENKLSLLEPLLEHPDVDVQSRAASYFLIVNEAKALKKLEALKKLGGIKGFEVEMIIDQWKKGELIVDHD